MRNMLLAFVLMLSVFFGQHCQAKGWDQVRQTLDAWQGEREVVLRTSINDPYSDMAVQSLIELLIKNGYSVIVDSSAKAPKGGFVLELRPSENGWFLAISRSEDSAVIGMARYESASTGLYNAKPRHVTFAEPKQFASQPSSEVRVALPGSPKRIAWLGSASIEDCAVALLYDDKVAIARLVETKITIVAEHAVPLSTSRALWLDAGNLDDDGIVVIAGTWAQDIHAVDEGVNSTIHSWVFEYRNEQLLVKSRDLESYVRILGGNGYAQGSGEFSLYQGRVQEIVFSGKRFEVGKTPIEWPTEFLLSATPSGKEEFYVWADDCRLGIAAKHLEGYVIIEYSPEDFGVATKPTISVRSRVPEFRAGFSTDARVMEKQYTLPGRIAFVSPGLAYAIRHKRQKGIRILDQADSGEDALVRIARTETGLILANDVKRYEAYVVDFTLALGEHNTTAMMLMTLNDSNSAKTILVATDVE